MRWVVSPFFRTRAQQDQRLKSEHDTHEFVAYFQKELNSKEAMIGKLTDELIRKEVSHTPDTRWASYPLYRTSSYLSEIKFESRT